MTALSYEIEQNAFNTITKNEIYNITTGEIGIDNRGSRTDKIQYKDLLDYDVAEIVFSIKYNILINHTNGQIIDLVFWDNLNNYLGYLRVFVGTSETFLASNDGEIREYIINAYETYEDITTLLFYEQIHTVAMTSRATAGNVNLNTEFIESPAPMFLLYSQLSFFALANENIGYLFTFINNALSKILDAVMQSIFLQLLFAVVLIALSFTIFKKIHNFIKGVNK